MSPTPREFITSTAITAAAIAAGRPLRWSRAETLTPLVVGRGVIKPRRT